MKIVVTGSNGFIGKNLVAELNNQGYHDLFCFDRLQTLDELSHALKTADFVFHLAGINRPEHVDEFKTGNTDLTQIILNDLKQYNSTCSLLLSSSIQAELDNAYGQSKKAAEDLVFEYGKINNSYVYRLPNVFGKWSQPNYNTVVATYCHNITRDLPIQINNPDAQLTLVYIDDIVQEWIRVLETKQAYVEKGYCKVLPEVKITLKELSDLLYTFKESRHTFFIPELKTPFVKKLHSTYLSFLPTDKFSYPLKMNEDARGSFTEFIKTEDRGQVSINVAKPGITKGNHWHHTKNEKFLVVSGEAIIRFRKIDTDTIIEYPVSGEKLEVVDIPCGYTHNIQNVGTTDLITVMWANELLDSEHPDTYFKEV